MPSPFERSEETAALVRFLQSHEKGARITYGELSQQMGRSIRPNDSKLIYARQILTKQHNAVWVCVRPAVGLHRLTDAEIAERLPAWWLKGARSKLRRGGDETDVVEIAQLDIDQQARFAVNSIQSELAREALSRATKKKMEKVARGTSNDLPSFTAVEWAITLSPRRK
jgi:hypothetical protein